MVTGKLFINCKAKEKINTKMIRSLMLDKHVQLEVRGTEKLSWVEAGDSRVQNKSKKLLSTVTRSKLIANPPA